MTDISDILWGCNGIFVVIIWDIAFHLHMIWQCNLKVAGSWAPLGIAKWIPNLVKDRSDWGYFLVSIYLYSFFMGLESTSRNAGPARGMGIIVGRLTPQHGWRVTSLLDFTSDGMNLTKSAGISNQKVGISLKHVGI